MRPFDHFSPQTLGAALDLLAEFNGQGHAIAGGTDLLLKMKTGMLAPEAVINIKRLPELQGITFNEQDGMRMGALATLRDITRSPIVAENYPCLAHTASLMASEQIRSFATVGGNLCNASPAADLAPPLIALEARAFLASQEGDYSLPLEAFFLGPGKSALRRGELLKDIHLPLPAGKSIYLKHAPRALMDIAMVGVAINLILERGVCRSARIVLGAVAPVPVRAYQAEACLAKQALTKGLIAHAASTAAQECSPIDDVRGAAWYRREMVAVLVRRGLAQLAA